MKFLVPNYSCLQNPRLGATAPRSPFSLSSTEFVEPPPTKQNSWVRHCPPQRSTDVSLLPLRILSRGKNMCWWSHVCYSSPLTSFSETHIETTGVHYFFLSPVRTFLNILTSQFTQWSLWRWPLSLFFTQPANSYDITHGHRSVTWPPVYLKLCHSFTFSFTTHVLGSTCPRWLTHRVV